MHNPPVPRPARRPGVGGRPSRWPSHEALTSSSGSSSGSGEASGSPGVNGEGSGKGPAFPVVTHSLAQLGSAPVQRANGKKKGAKKQSGKKPAKKATRKRAPKTTTTLSAPRTRTLPRRSTRSAAPKNTFDIDLGLSSEEEEEELVAPDDSGDEFVPFQSSERQRQKARERNAAISSNKKLGEAIDSDDEDLQLGRHAGNASAAARRILETQRAKTRKKPLDKLRRDLGKSSGKVTPTAPRGMGLEAPDFFDVLRTVPKVPSSLSSVQIGTVPFGLGTKTARKNTDKAPTRQRLNLVVASNLGTSEAMSKTKPGADLDEEALAELESARDPRSAEASKIKQRLRREKALTRKRERDPTDEFAVQDIVGANLEDARIRRLKDQRAGKLLKFTGTDPKAKTVELGRTSSGTPVTGGDLFSSVKNLKKRPARKQEQSDAVRQFHRVARADFQFNPSSPSQDEIDQVLPDFFEPRSKSPAKKRKKPAPKKGRK